MLTVSRPTVPSTTAAIPKVWLRPTRSPRSGAYASFKDPHSSPDGGSPGSTSGGRSRLWRYWETWRQSPELTAFWKSGRTTDSGSSGLGRRDCGALARGEGSPASPSPPLVARTITSAMTASGTSAIATQRPTFAPPRPGGGGGGGGPGAAESSAGEGGGGAGAGAPASLIADPVSRPASTFSIVSTSRPMSWFQRA